MDTEHWFALPVADVVERLETDPVHGLTSAEVVARQKKYPPNRPPEPERDTFLKRLLRQFTNPIAIALVVAVAFALYIGTLTDALVIAAALLIDVVIGVFQEERAATTFAALRQKKARKATVLRNGEPREVSADELVPGDLVTLIAGAAVPADLRLVETHELSANESMLSGEWLAVGKKTEPVAKGAPLAERTSMIYAGTLVSAGTGKGIVVATGAATEFGKIAASLAETKEPETPLSRDLRHAAWLLLVVATVAVGIVFVLALIDHMPVKSALLIAIALAVASVPEGLPAAVTVALALGMERILKKGGLVKNLLAAETLGATSVVLTDKTGTLTEGRLRVSGFATPSGTTEDVTGEAAKYVLRAAVLSSDGFVEQVPAAAPGDDVVRAHGRPIEQAIVLTGFTAGISTELRQEHPRLDELPFTAERRFDGRLVEESGHAVAYLAGAPELFIEHARKARAHSGARPFTDKDRTFFTEVLRRAGRAQERVIAVARVTMPERKFPAPEELGKMLDRCELLGFILFTDPVRAEAKEAVAAMKAAGARVVMATGDNPDTALAVARTVGIAGSRASARLGTELADLSDDALYKEIMTSHTVFARVAPKDKLRIANVLTARKEVVAMTGDGVNDAPALHASAIGVALGSGTEVAKESADLVLLNDSFSVITAAITEGRRLRDNMKKIFTFLVATNFSEVFVIVAALVLRLPLPLLPVQVLWSNLISGGSMNVAFAFEPIYPSAMQRSPKDPETATILSRSTLELLGLLALATGTLLIGLLIYLQSRGLPETEIRTLMFVGVSFDTLFTALSLKSFGTPIWRISLASNRFLLYALASSIIILAIALFAAPVAQLIQVVPLTWTDIGLLAGLGFLDLVMVELIKYFLFIRPRSRKAVRPA